MEETCHREASIAAQQILPLDVVDLIRFRDDVKMTCRTHRKVDGAVTIVDLNGQ